MNCILDVDTGYDDALALLLAFRSPEARVCAITCAAGNHTLAQVVTNTQKILDVLGADDVPVAAGATQSLFEATREPHLIHGHDGMADIGLPPTARKAQLVHAAQLIKHVVEAAAEPITLIALAPLTNVALFVRTWPALACKLQRIVIMGGTYASAGNTSPLAEFNFRADPEAAKIVIESGLPILVYPLDPFRHLGLTRSEIADMIASAKPEANAAGRILNYALNYWDRERTLIGDAGALAVAVDPSRAQIVRVPACVEVAGGARGTLVADRRLPQARAGLEDWWKTSPHEIDIVTGVDVPYYTRMFMARLMH
jgi:pyrimidine-specific ribonucleoside hydrolase